MTRMKTIGSPYSMKTSHGGQIKLSTFIPLKIRKSGVRS